MRTWLLFLFLLLGGTFLGAAFFAESIGLDNDPGWGNGRVFLFMIGLLLSALGIFQYVFTDTIVRPLRLSQVWLSEFSKELQQWTRRYGFSFPFAVLVVLVYIWSASSGSWTEWNSATRYYAELAEGFEHGQLHLLTRPNSELLSLLNPYDPVQRKGVDFPIDYSLYNRKFYMYWGPVPALILILINPLTSQRIGDLFLAFGFTVGIFILQYVFLLMIWDRFFRHAPNWLLILGIVVTGLNGPWMYMLVHEPNGRIYEAAIAGAQFFLLGGLLITVHAFSKSTLTYSALILSGLLWGLAIGTRLVIAVPIGVACLIIAYYLWINRTSMQNVIHKMLALGLPLIFCLVGIGWYNWARFGSITDTGFAYSLAHQDMLNHRNSLFSPNYVIQNLYNYVLNAPGMLPKFPFLRATGKTQNVLPFWDPLPTMYNAQPITGLVFVVPIVCFVSALFFRDRSRTENTARQINYIVAILLGTSASAFVFLLIFFWAALRYMGDFLPELVLASILGFWRGYQLLDQRPVMQRLYSVAGLVSATVGILVSLLISLSANQYSFYGLCRLM